MPKVMIGPAPLARLDGDFLTVLAGAGFEFVYPTKAVQMVEQDLLDQMSGIAAALAGSEPYTRKVFAAHPHLKVVARVGVGYDAVDVQAATDHGVVVTIAPGTNQHSVSEHCFMLMLALARSSTHVSTISIIVALGARQGFPPGLASGIAVART